MKTPVSLARCLPNATHCAVRRTPTIQTLLRTQQQEYVLSLFSSSISHPLYSVACWRCLQLTPRRCFSSSILRLSRDFSLIFFPSSILSLLCTSYIVTIFPFFSLHAKPVFCDYCLKVLLTPSGWTKTKQKKKKVHRKNGTKKKKSPEKKGVHTRLLTITHTHPHPQKNYYHKVRLSTLPPPLSLLFSPSPLIRNPLLLCAFRALLVYASPPPSGPFLTSKVVYWCVRLQSSILHRSSLDP